MKKTNFNFLEWYNNILISSLKKINFGIVLIVALDFLFYAALGYISTFWLQKIQAKSAAFYLPPDISSLGQEQMQKLLPEMQTFYYQLIFSFVLVTIAIIFLASIVKGIIWARTTRTKITAKLISRFLLLNLLWMGFWFLLLILVSLIATSTSVQIFRLAIIAIGLYFTNILYTIFMKEQRLKSIVEAIKLGIAKIHLLLLPYFLVLLLFFILANISNLLTFSYSNIIVSIILLTYIAVVRYYISALVMEVEKLK